MRAGKLTLAAGLALALALAAEAAMAQSSLGIGRAEVAVQPGGGWFGDVFTAIAVYQRDFFTSLRLALVELKQDGAAMPFLVGLSFAYGVFHAAGPGHGKAVISSYMLANEVELRRGITLSFASALLQALAALILVGAGWFVLRGTAVSMTDATVALEIASYALIAAFGGWLLLRKLGELLRRRRPVFALDFAPGGQTLAFAGQDEPGSPKPVMARASGGFAPGVCQDDAAHCGCGRAHMPNPQALKGRRLALGSAASAVFAVGLRPCSGAIVVLTFALLNGLYLGGVLSVLAMALGTAITVSIIATLAVFAKDLAIRFGGRGNAGAMVGHALEILGAALLLILGLALLGGALQMPA